MGMGMGMITRDLIFHRSGDEQFLPLGNRAHPIIIIPDPAAPYETCLWQKKIDSTLHIYTTVQYRAQMRTHARTRTPHSPLCSVRALNIPFS